MGYNVELYNTINGTFPLHTNLSTNAHLVGLVGITQLLLSEKSDNSIDIYGIMTWNFGLVRRLLHLVLRLRHITLDQNKGFEKGDDLTHRVDFIHLK